MVKKEMYVQSVMRSLELLKILIENSEGVGVGEAARMIGVTPPAAYSLLQTLAARGFAEKSNSKYRFGGEIVTLFKNYMETGLQRRVRNAILKLAGEYTDATISYSIVRGNVIQVLFRITRECPELIQVPNGLHYDIYFNLTGMAFMAFLTSEDAFKLRQSYPFDHYGRAHWASPEEYMLAVEEVGKNGFAAKNYSLEHTFRIALPVFSERRRFEGVLGISKYYPADCALPNKKEWPSIAESIRNTLKGME